MHMEAQDSGVCTPLAGLNMRWLVCSGGPHRGKRVTPVGTAWYAQICEFLVKLVLSAAGLSPNGVPMRRTLWTALTLSAAATFAAPAIPAAASTPAPARWHVIYQHQFGGFSLFTAIRPGGPGEMWAVGGYGAAGNGAAGAVLWHGRAWHVTRVPEPATLGTITAISADSASDAWAVTANGYVIRWDGQHWRVARRLPEPDQGPPGDWPTGVLAVSAGDVWVFYPTWRSGPHGTLNGGALHQVNGKWHPVSGRGRSVIAASEASRSDLWAIGGSATHAGLLRLARDQWRPVSVPGSAGITFTTVLAQRNRTVWVLGWPAKGTGRGTLFKLSGEHWSSYALPVALQQGPFSGTTALANDGHGGLWITVPAFYPHGGHLLHFSGGGWQQVNFAANVNADSVVTVPGTHTMCAAGQKPNYSSGNGPAIVWSTGKAC
jgi:hypothetical protein